MDEFKGTPGPWKYGFRNNNELMITFHGVFIGDVFLDITTSNDRKDALLISAAPELLNELIETHSALCFTEDYLGSFRYKKNKSVIAKALGIEGEVE